MAETPMKDMDRRSYPYKEIPIFLYISQQSVSGFKKVSYKYNSN